MQTKAIFSWMLFQWCLCTAVSALPTLHLPDSTSALSSLIAGSASSLPSSSLSLPSTTFSSYLAISSLSAYKSAPLRLRGGFVRKLRRALFQTSRLSGDCLSMLKAAGMRDQDVPADIRSALLSGRAAKCHLASYIAVVRGGVLVNFLGQLSSHVRNRLCYDLRFAHVLATELSIGCLSKLFALSLSLSPAFRPQPSLILFSLLLEFLGDLICVLLFAPAAPFAPPPPPLLASVSPFHKWPLLPAFAAQPGPFSMRARGQSLGLKAVQLGIVGAVISLIDCNGRWLLERARKTRHKSSQWGGVAQEEEEEEEEEEGGGIAWGGGIEEAVRFGCLQGVASNVRYQLLSWWEAYGLLSLPPQAHAAALVTGRFMNCWLGGLLQMQALQSSRERSRDRSPDPEYFY